jgi:hypothetical protein
MPIYASPFPTDGEDRCPDVYTAQRIIRCAIKCDGREIIGSELEQYLAPAMDGSDDPEIRLRVGINVMRRAVGDLWRRMSSRARAVFLYGQWVAVCEYMKEALDLIEKYTEPVPFLRIHMDAFDDYKYEMLLLAVRQQKPPDRKTFKRTGKHSRKKESSQ